MKMGSRAIYPIGKEPLPGSFPAFLLYSNQSEHDSDFAEYIIKDLENLHQMTYQYITLYLIEPIRRSTKKKITKIEDLPPIGGNTPPNVMAIADELKIKPEDFPCMVFFHLSQASTSIDVLVYKFRPGKEESYEMQFRKISSLGQDCQTKNNNNLERMWVCLKDKLRNLKIGQVTMKMLRFLFDHGDKIAKIATSVVPIPGK